MLFGQVLIVLTVCSGATSLDMRLLGKDDCASSSGDGNSDGLNKTTGTCAKCSVGIRICNNKNFAIICQLNLKSQVYNSLELKG